MAGSRRWKLFVAIALALMVGAVGGARLSSQSRQLSDADKDYRFRPDHEREALRGDKLSPYLQYQRREGVPSYKGDAQNVYEVALKPWKRLGPGVQGCFINLDGAGALVDMMVWEIPPGVTTTAERHLFEEQLLVVRGEGETRIWQAGNPSKKVTIPWKRGTVFSPPLNTVHEHVNKGKEPARMVLVTDAPLRMDTFRNLDFIFNTNYDFTDRYNNQPDYFDPENTKDYSPILGHSLSITNIIRDAWTWRLFHAGQGYGDIDRHYILSDNTMTGHVEGWAVGAYQRAHKHGPSSTIVHLGGNGYSLVWPGDLGTDQPWKDGKADKVKRVDWKEGTVVIPGIQHYHQHFATGPQHAKFIKLGSTPGNEKYAVTTNVLQGGEDRMILFKDEDPHVRELFEKELAKTGAKIIMPSHEELIKLEKDGRIPATE